MRTVREIDNTLLYLPLDLKSNLSTALTIFWVTSAIYIYASILCDMQGMEKVCYGGDSTFHDSYAKDPTKSLLNDDTACHECN